MTLTEATLVYRGRAYIRRMVLNGTKLQVLCWPHAHRRLWAGSCTPRGANNSGVSTQSCSIAPRTKQTPVQIHATLYPGSTTIVTCPHIVTLDVLTPRGDLSSQLQDLASLDSSLDIFPGNQSLFVTLLLDEMHPTSTIQRRVGPESSQTTIAAPWRPCHAGALLYHPGGVLQYRRMANMSEDEAYPA